MKHVYFLKLLTHDDDEILRICESLEDIMEYLKISKDPEILTLRDRGDLKIPKLPVEYDRWINMGRHDLFDLVIQKYNIWKPKK